MADHTLHMTNSWVYPHHQMLTHINCYTRENTHSHTRIHARVDNRLIFRFLRELGMITPSPSSRPRHRAYTPLPILFSVAENHFHFSITFFASDCFSASYRRILWHCRARSLYSRIVCAAEITFSRNVVV
jgi:hypothetical protein